MEKIPYLGQTITKWRVGASTFLAWPEKGARLMNWNMTLPDGSVRDVIYWPELANLDNFAHVRGGNPILFPFNARTFDRGDIHFWRAADGVRRAMPMHGFARQGDFQVTRLDERGFSALFLPGDEARACYPYDYEFTVSYRFEPLALFVELQLKNLGPQPIPWSAGHHFYFTVPWRDGARRSDYFIRIPAARSCRQAPDGRLLDGPHVKPEENLANPALIDALHTRLKSNPVVFGEKAGGDTLSLRFGADRTPPKDSALVTWSESETAPYYCVEPWMGLPNAPETNIGLHHVAPSETQTFVIAVSLK